MVFSSNIFLFTFLPFVLFCYFLTPAKFFKLRNFILLLTSLFFYAWGEFSCIWILILSIIGNYFFGLTIGNNSLKSKLSKGYKLFFALFFNLSLLLYFKYAAFFAYNFSLIFTSIKINKEALPSHLPIGISFFTFHAISYLIDIYRQKSKPQTNIINLALYISFFPQLIAGPIIRYNFIEKYLTKRRHCWFFFAYGVRRFIIGLGKKVIIANSLGEVADIIFNSPIGDINQPLAWVGIVCYTLQIYFDFSGYCDMAIGLARIFGFKFPENFNYPYVSKSIKEFWRRWHISLSSWFRDYVYIPLGGNRVSLSKQYFNLILVFFLCGLWHGASWNFIVWGLFHGFFLVIERTKIFEEIFIKIPNLLKHFYTIFIVMIGWIFFRSADLTSAINYLDLMFNFSNQEKIINNNISLFINSHFFITSLILAIIGFSPICKNISLKLIRKNKNFIMILDLFLLIIFFLSIIRLSAATHNPFIYFQF